MEEREEKGKYYLTIFVLDKSLTYFEEKTRKKRGFFTDSAATVKQMVGKRGGQRWRQD